tara:strand:+ start:10473 stop:10775 length:303 start_codon:yes stop_codon:yes gene_type:complete
VDINTEYVNQLNTKTFQICTPNAQLFNIKCFYYTPIDSNSRHVSLIEEYNPTVMMERDITPPKLNIEWGGRPDSAVMDDQSTGGISGYLLQLYGIENHLN